MKSISGPDLAMSVALSATIKEKTRVSNSDSIATFLQGRLLKSDRPEELVRNLAEKHRIRYEDAALIVLRVINERQKAYRPAIIHLELVIAEVCNLSCDYCFLGEKIGSIMDVETACSAIDFILRESGASETIYVTFFGGEPLLAFDTIRSTTNYGKKEARRKNKKIRWSMTSNGTLLDVKSLSFFRDHGVKVLLSMDGMKLTHDLHRRPTDDVSSYDQLYALLPLVKKYQPWMGARMTVAPDSARLMYTNVLHLIDAGFNQLIIAPAECEGWSRKAREAYVRQMTKVARFYKDLGDQGNIRINLFDSEKRTGNRQIDGKRGCRAGRTSVAVAPTGNLYPCSKFIDRSSTHQLYELGDVWQGIIDEERRNALSCCPWQRSCLRCDHLFRCSGGCLASNYHSTGSTSHTSNRECTLRKMQLRSEEIAAELCGSMNSTQSD